MSQQSFQFKFKTKVKRKVKEKRKISNVMSLNPPIQKGHYVMRCNFEYECHPLAFAQLVFCIYQTS